MLAPHQHHRPAAARARYRTARCASGCMKASLARGSHGGEFDNRDDRRADREAARRARRSCSATRTTPPTQLEDADREAPSRPSTSCSRSSARPRSPTRRREAADMQTMIDAEGGGFQPRRLGLGLLRGEGPRSERYAFDETELQALLRARPRAEGRRVLRRQQALRPHVQGAQGPAGLRAETCASSTCSTRTARSSALFLGDFYARVQQARRRLDERLRAAVEPAAARSPWSPTT